MLPFVKHGTREDLVDDILLSAVIDNAGLRAALPDSESGFERARQSVREGMVAVATELESRLYESMHKYQLVCDRLLARRDHFQLQCNDIDQQIERLLQPGFISQAGLERLREYPRYLEAIAVRLERLSGNSRKDSEYCEMLATVEQPLQKLLYQYPHIQFSDPAVAECRWLLEELRVSLFAQQLKTAVPVSFERVNRAWATIDHNQYYLPE